MTDRETIEHFKAWLPQEWQVLWIESPRPTEGDAVFELPQLNLRLALVIRRDPRIRQFPFGLGEAGRAGTVPVLAAPRVSPRLQEHLKKAGWGWVDAAGNGRVSLPGQFFIERSGNALPAKGPHEMELGSAQALQVVRILLHPDHAAVKWTLRDLQRESVEWAEGAMRLKEPSLGYLSRLLSFLIAEDFLTREKSRSAARLRDPEGLLEATARAYSIERVPCFSLFSRKKLEAGLKKVELLSGGFAAWAAFSAADLQAPAVQESKSWMMVSARFVDELKSALNAQEVRDGANLILLVPETDGPFYMGEGIGDRPRSTNPVQTYWDLSQAGGRGDEAAAAVLKRCLLPAWRSIGELR